LNQTLFPVGLAPRKSPPLRKSSGTLPLLLGPHLQTKTFWQFDLKPLCFPSPNFYARNFFFFLMAITLSRTKFIPPCFVLYEGVHVTTFFTRFLVGAPLLLPDNAKTSLFISPQRILLPNVCGRPFLLTNFFEKVPHNLWPNLYGAIKVSVNTWAVFRSRSGDFSYFRFAPLFLFFVPPIPFCI